MFHVTTELAHSGTDCSQLSHVHATQTSSSNLCPSEHPITVEINGSNPGTEWAENAGSILGLGESGFG